jgi:putative protease
MLKNSSKPVELLAPAGNFEKLEFALHYGADAVYLGGHDFSLRNFAKNFSLDEMEAAISLAHSRNAKVYVAVNLLARNRDIGPIETYLKRLRQLCPDGIIIADPAVIALSRKVAPQIPIHLSTQASTTNFAAADFWYTHGVKRINLARELSLSEISEIAAHSPVTVEAFVHGAMCISYSGRCLLSNFMARRSSNQGMCCHPCRFQYTVVEETRPGQYFPIAEDNYGTYIFNSKDLCMLPHLPAMIDAGIDALKIEGRMKGIHYTATVVKVYREAIDRYHAAPLDYAAEPYWQAELDKITVRGYCTGFYFNEPDQSAPNYSAPKNGDYQLVGNVVASGRTGMAHIEVRNRIQLGDQIEVVKPKGPPISDHVIGIIDGNGDPIEKAQPGSRVAIEIRTLCERYDLLRKRISAAGSGTGRNAGASGCSTRR